MFQQKENLPDTRKLKTQQSSPQILKNLLTFKIDLKINYKYIFLANLMIYECYHQYRQFQELENIKQETLEVNEEVIAQSQTNLKEPLYLGQVDDLKYWPFFTNFDTQSKTKYLQKCCEYQSNIQKFNNRMALIMIAGFNFPISTVVIGMTKHLLEGQMENQTIYKDESIEIDLEKLEGYSLIALSMFSCVKFII